MRGTPRPDLGPRDPTPADCTPPTSEGGSGNGAKADRSRKTKEQVEHLLANLEEVGVEIDGKITSIVDAEITKIKAETSREAINESKRGGAIGSVVICVGLTVLTAVSGFAGFIMGAEWFARAFRAEYARRTGRFIKKKA